MRLRELECHEYDEGHSVPDSPWVATSLGLVPRVQARVVLTIFLLIICFHSCRVVLLRIEARTCSMSVLLLISAGSGFRLVGREPHSLLVPMDG